MAILSEQRGNHSCKNQNRRNSPFHPRVVQAEEGLPLLTLRFPCVSSFHALLRIYYPAYKFCRTDGVIVFCVLYLCVGEPELLACSEETFLSIVLVFYRQEIIIEEKHPQQWSPHFRSLKQSISRLFS